MPKPIYLSCPAQIKKGGPSFFKFDGKDFHPVDRLEMFRHHTRLRGWLFEITDFRLNTEMVCLFLGEDDFFWLFRQGKYHKMIPGRTYLKRNFLFFKNLRVINYDDSIELNMNFLVSPLVYIFPDDYNHLAADDFSDTILTMIGCGEEFKDRIRGWGARLIQDQFE